MKVTFFNCGYINIAMGYKKYISLKEVQNIEQLLSNESTIVESVNWKRNWKHCQLKEITGFKNITKIDLRKNKCNEKVGW